MMTFSRIALTALTVGAASIGAIAVNEISAGSTLPVVGKTSSLVTVKGTKAPVAPSEMALAGRGVDQSRIESSSVVTHVEVIGGARDAKIVLLDPNGEVVFETDPTTNTTVVARDVVVPSVTIRSGDGETAELRIVSAAPPIRAPMALAEALESGERLGADIFYKGDFYNGDL